MVRGANALRCKDGKDQEGSEGLRGVAPASEASGCQCFAVRQAGANTGANMYEDPF